MKTYTVNVGNIGNVLETNNLTKANREFKLYVSKSKNNEGRASGENVFIMNNKSNDIEREFFGLIYLQD